MAEERGAAGAVVLTGGRAVRLGGADKASLEVGGMTLLERVLAALDGVPEVVVVGPEVPTSRPVTFAREDPPGGGPAAGVLVGVQVLRHVPHLRPWVLVLAVDMPLVSSATVGRLLEHAHRDGAVLVDAAGRTQYLCAAYSLEALERAGRAAGEGGAHDLAMRRLVEGLDLVRVPAAGAEARDVDTWQDVAEVRDAVDRDDPQTSRRPPGSGS